jgi:hypothetical protein
MSSGELIPDNQNSPESADNEVQFALVIARMIETVQNNPEHLRQTVYDLARYKLQEQFTDSDAREIRRTEQALETAIRGVEAFSRQQIAISPPPQVPQLEDRLAGPKPSAPEPSPPTWLRSPLEIGPAAVPLSRPAHPIWPPIKRTAAMLVIVGGGLLAVQQRERLISLMQYFPAAPEARRAPAPAVAEAAPKPLSPKPNPLRPTDYGVYALGTDSLTELQPLPGRAPDIRVAVSAAFKAPSRAVLPNGHPRFVVFRREAALNISDRAEVRMVARIAREFSAEAAGKKPEAGDDTWVIRNVSFPFRSSPMPDSPDMYELHSEDPALELTPGRYALILKTQAYDFTVDGVAVDPRQCIERIVATNGTFYTDCKKP